MFIGRRRYQDWNKKQRLEKISRPRLVDLDRVSFQTRYSVFLMTSCGGAFLIFAGPAAWFLLQNQKLFEGLAYDVAPELISHLERESSWLLLFFIVGFGLISAAAAWLGQRLTRHLMLPLSRMERHLDLLNQGQWNQDPLSFRSDDDFRKLYESYNRLFRSLKEKQEKELSTLERMNFDPEQRQNWVLWQSLMQDKRKSLGLSKSDFATLSAAAEPERRAS